MYPYSYGSTPHSVVVTIMEPFIQPSGTPPRLNQLLPSSLLGQWLLTLHAEVVLTRHPVGVIRR